MKINLRYLPKILTIKRQGKELMKSSKKVYII